MEREEFKKRVSELSSCSCKQCASEEKSLLTEFDRLVKENDTARKYAAKVEYERDVIDGCLHSAHDEIQALQSHLDRISEPIRDEHYHLIRDVAKSLRRAGYVDTSKVLEAIADYLDSQQKPSEKPQNEPEQHYNDDFDDVHQGNKAVCPICNPKCEHKKLEAPVGFGGGPMKQWCLDCSTWVELPKPPNTEDRKGTIEIVIDAELIIADLQGGTLTFKLTQQGLIHKYFK